MSETWTFVCATGDLLPGEMRTTFDEITSVPIIVGTMMASMMTLAGSPVSNGAGSGGTKGSSSRSSRSSWSC